MPLPHPDDLGVRVLAAARNAGLPAHLAEQVAVHAPSVAPPAGPVVVACDLDRTLIYSAKSLGLDCEDADAPRLVVGEVYLGAPLSFYTRDAEAILEVLAEAATLVPTTTRTRAQYARTRLPGPTPRYAVTANGGHILLDGRPCPDWAAQVAANLDAGCDPLTEIVEHLEKVSDPLWLRNLRVAEDLFAYLVVERAELPAMLVTDLTGWCAERGWTVSLQGRKLYCVPGPLTKSAATAEVAARVCATRTLAAGDSLLDADLLAAADEAVRPAHGELHDLDWHLPHVAVTDRAGVFGGQEVVARLLASVFAA